MTDLGEKESLKAGENFQKRTTQESLISRRPMVKKYL